ncbi:MAG TPA: hypothetical protein V6D33_15275 [Cyanophyceae cyanobacterium]
MRSKPLPIVRKIHVSGGLRALNLLWKSHYRDIPNRQVDKITLELAKILFSSQELKP